MLYLIAAILGSSSLVIILKMFDLKRVNMYLGITLNYLVGGVLAFAFAQRRLTMGEIVGSDWFWMAVVIGVVFVISFVIYGLSAQRSGIAVTTISGRAAVVIPVVFAFVVLGEQPTLIKISMLVLIIFSMWLVLHKTPKLGNVKVIRGSLWALLLPVAVFLANGTSDTLVQYGQRIYIDNNELIPVFMGTMFASGTISGLLFFAISCIKKPHLINARDVLWGSLLGVLNWVCMIGVFNALSVIDGAIFYPLYYMGAIVCSTVVGVWLFKERLSRVNYVGIVIASIAIAILSMQ